MKTIIGHSQRHQHIDDEHDGMLTISIGHHYLRLVTAVVTGSLSGILRAGQAETVRY